MRTVYPSKITLNQWPYPSAPGVAPSLVGKWLAGGKLFYFLDPAPYTQPATVYQDAEGTISYPHPITLSPTGSVGIIYLEAGTYYVVITDSEGNVANPLYTFTVIESGSGTPVGKQHYTFNLSPIFGFETKQFAEAFNDEQTPLPAGRYPLSGGFWFENDTTNANEKNWYKFSELGNTNIPNDPKNLLFFASTLNSTGDTFKAFGFEIQDYNSFQGKQLAFQIYTRKISGGFSTLPCYIRRTLRGVAQTPIFVGNITVGDTQLTQSGFTFTVPNLAQSGYANDDYLEFYIEMPPNQDFQIEMTAVWLQESPDGSIDLHQLPKGIGTASRAFISQFQSVLNSDKYSQETAGNPMVWGYYRPTGADSTGLINLTYGPENQTQQPRNYIRCNDRDVIYANDIWGDANAIKYTLKADLTQVRSRHRFGVTNVGSTQLDFGTTIATTQRRTWASTNPGAIGLSIVQQEYPYRIVVRCLGESTGSSNWNKIQFTWLDNGAILTGLFDPITFVNNGKLFSTFTPQPEGAPNAFVDGGLQPVIANYCARIYAAVALQGGQPIWSADGNFLKGLDDRAVQGSGSQPVQYTLDLETSLHFANAGLPATYWGNPNSGSWGVQGLSKNFRYEIFRSLTEPFPADNAPDIIYPLGYLAWANPGQTIAPFQGTSVNGVYPNILGFSVDGDGAPSLPTVSGGGNRIIVAVNFEDSLKDIAIRIREEFNKPRVAQITVNGIPNQGDRLLIDNGDTDIAMVFWDTTLPKPTRTPNEKNYYIPFETGISLTQLRNNIAEALNLVGSGCASPRYYGLEIPDVMSAVIKT